MGRVAVYNYANHYLALVGILGNLSRHVNVMIDRAIIKVAFEMGCFTELK